MIQFACEPVPSGKNNSACVGSDSEPSQAPGSDSDSSAAASFALSNLGLSNPSVRNLECIACMFYAYDAVKHLDSVKTKISTECTSDFTTNDYNIHRRVFAGSFEAALRHA